MRQARRKTYLKVNLFTKKQLTPKKLKNDETEINNEKKSPPNHNENSSLLDIKRIDEYPNVKVVQIDLEDDHATEDLLDGVKFRYILFKDRLLVGK
jgi:hypothetical protein